MTVPRTLAQPHRRRTLILAVALGIAALLLTLSRDFLHDDAYITLRYVQRWLSGQGLTWTAGATVEGYTHPLWLLQIALLGLAGIELTLAPRLLGVLYLLGIFGLWARKGVRPLPLLVLVTIPGVIVWTVGGLETISFAFWVVLGCALLDTALEERSASRRALGVGFVFSLAALTRPEGFGLGLLAIAWLATTRSLARVSAAAAGFGLPLGLFLYIRWVVYGELLSLSSIAKLGGFGFWFDVGNGLEYLRSYAIHASFVGYCVLAMVLGRWRCRACVPGSLAAALVGVAVVAGGDHMGYGRFLVPALVVMAWAAAEASEPRTPRAAALVGVVAALTLGVHALVWQAVLPVRPDRAAFYGASVGSFLQELLPAGSLVAVATAGATPFHAPDLEFIDTLGLNDPVIANRRPRVLQTVWQLKPGHQRGDGAYVLAREPDVIVLGPARGYLGHAANRWFLSDMELMESPEFRARYEPWAFVVNAELLNKVRHDRDASWTRATGLAPDARPEALTQALEDDTGNRAMLIAFLRRDSARVSGLAARGVSLESLWASMTPTYDPICQQATGLRASVPCEDKAAR